MTWTGRKILSSSSSDAGRTPVVETGGLPAGNVHRLQIAGFEPGFLQQAGNRAIEVATAAQLVPERVHALLPAPNVFVGCFTVFAKKQFSTRLEHPANFLQG